MNNIPNSGMINNGNTAKLYEVTTNRQLKLKADGTLAFRLEKILHKYIAN